MLFLGFLLGFSHLLPRASELHLRQNNQPHRASAPEESPPLQLDVRALPWHRHSNLFFLGRSSSKKLPTPNYRLPTRFSPTRPGTPNENPLHDATLPKLPPLHPRPRPRRRTPIPPPTPHRRQSPRRHVTNRSPPPSPPKTRRPPTNKTPRPRPTPHPLAPLPPLRRHLRLPPARQK